MPRIVGPNFIACGPGPRVKKCSVCKVERGTRECDGEIPQKSGETPIVCSVPLCEGCSMHGPAAIIDGKRDRLDYCPSCADRLTMPVPVEETRVVNIHSGAKYDFYIGRGGKGLDGYYGNRHRVGACFACGAEHTREQAVSLFRAEFIIRYATDAEFRRRVEELRGKTLGCFCAPALCHGSVYAEHLNFSQAVVTGGGGMRPERSVAPPPVAEMILEDF